MSGIGTALSQLIDLIVSGLLDFAAGIAAGINAYTMALLFETTGTGAEMTIVGLSAFGGTVAIFAAVALSVGLTSLIFQFIKSLGGN